MPPMKNQSSRTIFIFVLLVGAGGAFFFVYANAQKNLLLDYTKEGAMITGEVRDVFVPTHIETPREVRAIYMTSWVAGDKDFRKDVIDLVEETEINSVVIDIKDYSGKIAFPIDDPLIEKYQSVETRVPDIKEFIEELHSKGIYVIGRVTVFQDPYLAKRHPEFAVLRESDKGVWEDFKGLSFTDPGNKEVWDYHIAIAEGAYNLGFDEINFDYIRFPSDGNMKDIYFPKSEEAIAKNPQYGKADVIESFFSYLDEHLDDSIVTSADIFGMTTSTYSDLNIGQVLERALPHFDYVAPMVYPSHYPKHFIGLNNPNDDPYRVINYSMNEAVRRARSTTTPVWGQTHTLLSTTTKPYTYKKRVYDAQVLRPWLQDFDYGGDYGPEEVREQIQATYDAGLNSWMLWAPSNRYTKEALLPFYIKPQNTASTTVGE